MALLASLAAQGLFHRAAVQSGLYRSVMAKDQPVGAFPSASLVGMLTAVNLGCTSGDIAACLRTRTPGQVLEAQAKLGPMYELGLPLTPTLPVVDGVILPGRPLAPLPSLGSGRGPGLDGPGPRTCRSPAPHASSPR